MAIENTRGRRLVKLRLKLCTFAALGPGKADLLESIDTHGSISAAARAMEMSYRRAWLLVDEMNRAFRGPVIDTSFGGAQGGGARLTELGRTVLDLYRRMHTKAEAVLAPEIEAIQSLLSDAARAEAGLGEGEDEPS